MDSFFRTRATIENVQLIDKVVDGLTLRLYRMPRLENSAERVPGMIFYHGGGFSLGDLGKPI